MRIHVDYNILLGTTLTFNNDEYVFILPNNQLVVDRYNKSTNELRIEIDTCEKLQVNGEYRYRLVGWMADLDYMLPPKSILLATNSKIKGSNSKLLMRPDVRKHLSSYIDLYGFTIGFNSQLTDDNELIIIMQDSGVKKIKIDDILL